MNMNKKIMQGLVATCLAVSSVSMGVGPVVQPIVAMASDLTEGYAEITLGGTTSIGDTNVISLADAGITASAAGEVIIPETVEYEGVTYKITSIGEQAFYKKTGIKSITIPASVKTIGINAFAGCTGMTTVDIKGVETIEDKAFQGCTKLTTINLPSSLESLGDYVFYNNKVMTEITLPEGLKTMGDYVFYKCAALKTVSFPSTLEGIGAFTFQECTNLESVNLAEGIKSIGESAFAGCTKLTSIDLPESLSSIGSSAFDGCSGITEVNLGVSEIPYRAFRNCSSLTSVTLREGVESIGNIAFGACTNIKEITLPSTMKTIDTYGFYKCTSLEEVHFSEGLESIGDQAFAYCNNIKSIILPEGITSVGEKAFYECTNATQISIPSTLEYIDSNAFYGCNNLENLTIMEGVKRIGTAAFYNCNRLEEINLPSTVNSLGAQSFYGCNNVKKINYQGNISSMYSQIFYSDTARAVDITLKDTNTKASEYDYASDNITATFNIIQTSGDNEEDTETILEEITLTSSETTVDTVYKRISLSDAGISTTGNIIIPETVEYNGIKYKITEIFQYAFENCTEITSVKIPSTVTIIRPGAFYGCTNLTKVELPEGIESLGDNTFKQCTNLSVINIPEGLSSIGYNTFQDCINLSEIELPSTIKTINSNAFSGCTGLKSVSLNYGLETIGEKAFYECENLSEIILPSTIKTLDNRAFHGCVNVKTIKYLGDITTMGTYVFYDEIEREVEIIAEDTNTVALNYDYESDNIIKRTQSDEITLADSTSISSSANTITLEDAGINTAGEVVIPEKVKYAGTTYTVTSLQNTFANNNKITSVVVPDTVTSIDGAFAGCDKLETVTINSNVESIAEDSFQVDTEKDLTIITDEENTVVTEYDYAADNIVASFSLRSTSPDSGNTGDLSNQNDMAVTGYISPITEMDVTIPLDGFRFHIDENRDLIPTISNLENDSQFPLDVNALNINGSTGTEPSVIAESTYTEYQWNNMNKADTLSKMALYLNGSELFNIFQNDSLDSNKAINIGRLESGFSGTSTLEVTPDAQYGKNFGNRTDMLTFVYDLVLEFAVPMS